MNHYTTVPQSQKLLELGLDHKTADMVYIKYADTDNPTPKFEGSLPMALGDIPIDEVDCVVLACWSLGALLEVMPKGITGKDGIDYKLLLDVKEGFPKYYSTSYEIYHEDFPYPIRDEGKTLFEYLVEGVIWLLENEYIKKEPNTSNK